MVKTSPNNKEHKNDTTLAKNKTVSKSDIITKQKERHLGANQAREVLEASLAVKPGVADKNSVSPKRKELISSIKSKKELSGLDDDFVQQKVDKIFNADHTLKNKFEASKDFSQFSRSKEYNELLKKVRKELRAIYGVFQQENVDRYELLTRLRSTPKENEKKEILKTILGTHTSTKERIPYYDEIYAKICTDIKPKIVIDLGCGVNPLAYNYFIKHNCDPRIIASDISKDDMKFLNDCFNAADIPGRAIALDLTKEEDIEKLRELKGDVTLLLKLLDSLEEAKRHISYKIFDAITTPWIIASFPTKSLGGKKNIARTGRAWFERLLVRKEMTWEMFSVENELFYVIKRK